MEQNENYNFFGKYKAVRLTQQKTNELIIKIQAKNDRIAFDQLIRANLGFIIHVSKQFENKGLDQGELINEAVIGMYQAVKKFDTARNIKFISYAVWWIRQRMQAALHISNNLVILPPNKLKLLREIKKMTNKGFKYSDLTTKFENMDEVDNVLRASNPIVSLDHPVSEESDESFIDLISESPKQLVELEYKNLLKLIDDMNILSEKECEIIKMSYGIGYEFEYNLQQIANKFDLSRERIRQIKDDALKKLRANAKGLLE